MFILEESNVLFSKDAIDQVKS